MTLCITLINEAGIWQSSDHFVRFPKHPASDRNDCPKHVEIICSDGQLVISLAGIGQLSCVASTVLATKVVGWLTDPNTARTVDQTVERLRLEANRGRLQSLSRDGVRHVFVCAAHMQSGDVAAWELSNHGPSKLIKGIHVSDLARVVEEEFQAYAIPVSPPLSVRVAGHQLAKAEWDKALYGAQRLRRGDRIRELLADVNRETALNSLGVVSQHCTVTGIEAGKLLASLHRRSHEPIVCARPVVVHGRNRTVKYFAAPSDRFFSGGPAPIEF
jgi:hypothetical protein